MQGRVGVLPESAPISDLKHINHPKQSKLLDAAFIQFHLFPLVN
jgi:hypothetical protein